MRMCMHPAWLFFTFLPTYLHAHVPSWELQRYTTDYVGRFVYLETSREGRPQASPRAQLKSLHPRASFFRPLFVRRVPESRCWHPSETDTSRSSLRLHTPFRVRCLCICARCAAEPPYAAPSRDCHRPARLAGGSHPIVRPARDRRWAARHTSSSTCTTYGSARPQTSAEGEYCGCTRATLSRSRSRRSGASFSISTALAHPRPLLSYRASSQDAQRVLSTPDTDATYSPRPVQAPCTLRAG